MDDEQIKRIIEDTYDDSKKDSYWTLVKDFYSRRMLWLAILVWAWVLIFLVPTVFSAIMFFMSDQTKYQIMHATIFTCCIACIGFIKVFAQLMLHKVGIRREIKRLEIRIAELTQVVKDK